VFHLVTRRRKLLCDQIPLWELARSIGVCNGRNTAECINAQAYVAELVIGPGRTPRRPPIECRHNKFRDRSSISDEIGVVPEIDYTPTVSWLRSPRSSWTLEDRSAVSATHGQAVVLVILDGDGPEHWRETQGSNAS
jgi:hypothetical protein